MNPLKSLLDLTGKLPWEEKEKQGRWELKKVTSALHTSDALRKHLLPGRRGCAESARAADDSALRSVGRCSGRVR